MTLTLFEQEPLHVTEQLAFVDGPGLHEMRRVPVKRYPQDGRAERLAAKRRNAELTIRQASQRFGVTAGEWSGLEIGRYTLSDDQWTWLLSQI